MPPAKNTPYPHSPAFDAMREALRTAPELPIGFAGMSPAEKMRFALDYADWWRNHCGAALALAASEAEQKDN